MALSYCEICGVLIKGEGGLELPEGVICDGCYESRQVEVGTSTDDEEAAAFDLGAMIGPQQFECVYCRSLLRLPLPEARTSVRCPQCHETFFLLPDGTVEARMQGNTTAILPKEQALRSLTPGSSAGFSTQPLRTQNKTQPIDPVSDSQKVALRDLAARNLDIVKSLPSREILPVDTKRRERTRSFKDTSGQNLDLLPEDVGPGDTSVQFDREREVPGLHASDEGQIDLDAEGLKRRASRKKGRGERPEGRGRGSREQGRGERPEGRGRGSREQGGAKKAKRKAKREKGEKSQSHERREARQATASKKGQDLQKSGDRRAVKSGLLWIVAALPAILCLVLISMTARQVGFASRGEVGARLEAFGHQVDLGLRSLNQLVPESARPPQIGEKR